MRWTVSGRLPAGARIALQGATTARGGGVTRATASARCRLVRLPAGCPAGGDSRLSLVVSVRGIPFRGILIPRNGLQAPRSDL
jgi:hypothetical protein